MSKFKVGDLVRFKDKEHPKAYYPGEYTVTEIRDDNIVTLDELPYGGCSWYTKRLELAYQLSFKWNTK